MSTNEAYTANEIMDILTELGVEVSYTSAEDDEFNIATIDCEIDPINFFCFLVVNGPFFEGIKLHSFGFRADNPIQFVNDFNKEMRIARASLKFDEDGLIEPDENGEASMHAQADLHFAGGVTKDHVRFMFEMWIEDLIDFHEITIDEESDEEEPVKIRGLSVVANATLQVQITACLSDGRSMTSREISRLLDTDRHIINSILYKERNRFVNDGGQPPSWSLRAKS
jgi:Putative bacterial sensory transduction regulator